jgi:hypothetical protein
MVIAKMKRRVIETELAKTYEHLAGLDMAPAEMVAALEAYIETREEGERHE